MKIGAVFRWIDFPYQHDGDKKDRYFVYLGKTGYGFYPVMIYCCTTTTQRHYYFNENRKNHHIHQFRANEYGFTHDCILDFDLGMESIPETNFQTHLKEINEVGLLPDSILKKLWEIILKADISVKTTPIQPLKNNAIFFQINYLYKRKR